MELGYLAHSVALNIIPTLSLDLLLGGRNYFMSSAHIVVDEI